MKVALISTEMNPVPPVVGGAIQTYIEGVLPYLSTDYEVTVLSVKHESLPDFEFSDRVTYFRFDRTLYEHHVFDHLQRHSYDILHVFNRPHFILNYHHASPRSKLILSLHNEMMAENKISTFRGNRVVTLCHAIVTISQYIKSTVIDRFPHAEAKTYPIYSAVDMQRYRPYWMDEAVREKRIRLREEFGLKGRKVILFVGRLSKVKGVHLLIQAMEIVAAEHPNAMLLIVGSKWFGTNETNKYVDSLHVLARSIPNNVKFARFVPPSRVPDFYAMADLFVCVSQWNEPLARVHYEAMASGLPILTTDRGGNTEVVQHGRNGLVLSNSEYNQPEAIAQSIFRLLQNEDEASALAYAGYLSAKRNFTFDRLGNDIKAVYERITK
jgi:Glycosyltransferase